ncbi:alpha/beta hydrolase family protein [Paenibacillus guangzhouensis]|uniref:alpha/beta hydrolase family protein n=1 Tax=Paenibacillus guangzhouensis TaxID=1473112 RepID=UPI0012669A44|nr:carboxylic ester hydrolase [Paenibacillus guangzhouensis]
MRTMEFIVIIVHFLILVRLLFFRRGGSPGNVMLIGVAAVITALQIGLEGYRSQMIPAYLMFVWILLQVVIDPSKYTVSASAVSRICKGGVLGLYMFVAIALPILMPVFSLDKPSGPYAVGTMTFHFTDDKRQEEYAKDPSIRRELMVQLWYPAKTGSDEPTAPYTATPQEIAIGLGTSISIPAIALEQLGQVKTHSHLEALLPDQEQAWPLLVFSHGMDRFRNSNTFQVEELASHGYIVAAIDHTYDAAATVFPDGRVTYSRSQLDDGIPALDARMPVWVSDVKFVLDQLERLNRGIPDSRFQGAIDMSRIGMFGHSYGGAAAMQMLLQDDRVKAGIDMDGGLYGIRAPEQGIGKPFMLMNAQDTEIHYQQAVKNPSDMSLDTYEGIWQELLHRRQLALAGGGYSVTIPHTDHMSYTDFPLYSPLFIGKEADIRYTHRIICDVSLSFFDKYVKGDDTIVLDDIGARYPDIELIKS